MRWWGRKQRIIDLEDQLAAHQKLLEDIIPLLRVQASYIETPQIGAGISLKILRTITRIHKLLRNESKF